MELTCALGPPLWLDETDYHSAHLGVLHHGRPVYCRLNGRTVTLGRTKKSVRTSSGVIEIIFELDDRLPEAKTIKHLLSKDLYTGVSVGTFEKAVPSNATTQRNPEWD